MHILPDLITRQVNLVVSINTCILKQELESFGLFDVLCECRYTSDDGESYPSREYIFSANANPTITSFFKLVDLESDPSRTPRHIVSTASARFVTDDVLLLKQ
jgi:hypothetical protein